MLLLRLLLTLSALLFFADVLPAAVPQRPLAVDDLFELENVGWYYGGPYAFSNDGTRFAMTRVRPKKTVTNHRGASIYRNDRADIWIRMKPNDALVNVTHGILDGSGWWAPQWSPDGQKLAMVSTRGGNTHLWVWDSGNRELRQMSLRSVDLPNKRERPFLWVDATRLLFSALPGEEQPMGMGIETLMQTVAAREWAKTSDGVQTTSSILDSGAAAGFAARPQHDLLLVNTKLGTQRVIVHGETTNWRLSPNGEFIAFLRKAAPNAPRADEPLPFESAGAFEVIIARADGTAFPVRGEMSRDVLMDSLRWSPNSNELAFLGYAADKRPPRLFRVDLPARAVTSRSLGALDAGKVLREPAGLDWTADANIILRAAERIDDSRPGVMARRDWWLVKKNDVPRNLTRTMRTPPGELWVHTGRHGFFGLADGDLWRIDPGAMPVNLTARFGPRIRALVWPSMANIPNRQYRVPEQTYMQAIVEAGEGNDTSFHLIDISSGVSSEMRKPTPVADFAAYEPVSNVALYHANDRDGLLVWQADVRDGETSILIEANLFLRNIAQAQSRPIDYVSLNGAKLKGWLILPLEYDENERYPLITWVYPGTIQGDRPSPDSASISSESGFNMQIPAARGYAVLLPSMPLQPKGLTDDPMLRLPEGVLPAVDKTVELGIADPKRLYLMGHSFGGFAVYGLVTQTKRFKAAISLAGFSNAVSQYGQFDVRFRYTDAPHEGPGIFPATWMESRYMGAPPWKDLGRYLRNSPIFYVDRVETPLMIIQGDVDFMALQQGEEFFFSLYRQGKHARFVRYWGEGHVIRSPANIRDMWRHIFEWFGS